MAKKSDFTIVTENLTKVREYNKTIGNAEKFLKEKDLDVSLRVTLEATLRMATDNRDSAVGTIFRKVAEHVGADEKALTTFVNKVFVAPVVAETK